MAGSGESPCGRIAVARRSRRHFRMPTLRLALLLALALSTAAIAASPAPDAVASGSTKETWAIATAKGEGGTIVYRFIDTLGPKAGERVAQPDRITLTWRYDADANNGMPTDDDKAGMDQLEDLLEPAVEIAGFSNLALVRTGDGVREWTYYARSGHEFLERMKAVLPGHPQFAGKVLVEVAADPGWSAYEDFRGHLQR